MTKLDKQTRRTLMSLLLGAVFIVLVFATGRGDDSQLWYFLVTGFIAIGSVIIGAFLFFFFIMGLRWLYRQVMSKIKKP